MYSIIITWSPPNIWLEVVSNLEALWNEPPSLIEQAQVVNYGNHSLQVTHQVSLLRKPAWQLEFGARLTHFLEHWQKEWCLCQALQYCIEETSVANIAQPLNIQQNYNKNFYGWKFLF